MQINATKKLRYIGDVIELRGVVWGLNAVKHTSTGEYYEVFPDGSDSMFRAVVPAKDFVSRND